MTIYLPDEVLARLRRRAKKARKSLSAYIAELIEPSKPGGWPPGFADLYGSWEGPFPQPDDSPPDEPDALR